MHHFSFLATMLLALPALAEPVVRPACAVTIAHAPDDVRAVVEQWVAAEPRCGGALEVRIVQTTGGLYLFARDDRGRVRERTVPDATSAGVLVASWAADDAMIESAPSAVVAPVALAPAPVEIAPVAPLASAPVASAPAAIAPEAAPSAVVLQPEGILVVAPGALSPRVMLDAPPEPERWISLGAGLATNAINLRASVDLWAQGSWTLGLAGSVSSGSTIYVDGGTITPTYTHTRDLTALAQLSHLSRLGGWRFRAGVGGGLDFVRVDDWVDHMGHLQANNDGIRVIGQVTLTAAHTLGAHWGVEAGAVYTDFFSHTDHMIGFETEPDADVMLFVGLQHRL